MKILIEASTKFKFKIGYDYNETTMYEHTIYIGFMRLKW